jgi:hypothetical protein
MLATDGVYKGVRNKKVLIDDMTAEPALMLHRKEKSEVNLRFLTVFHSFILPALQAKA